MSVDQSAATPPGPSGASGASGASRSSASAVESRITLVLLTFDGFLCAVLSVLFLPAYLGTTPFPVSILVVAVVNLLLVLGARTASDRPLAAALPIFGWLIGFVVCAAGGPGGDALVFSDWRTLLLLVAAVLPGGVYLFRVSLESMVARAQAS